MNIRYQYNCNNISWEKVPLLLKEVGMSYTDIETHRISFESSEEVVFVFDGEQLIAFGRAISDRVRQAAIYDVAVNPNYQGKRIGKEIVEQLMNRLPNCSFILYASPGKEDFYRKLKFKKMKTGMIYF